MEVINDNLLILRDILIPRHDTIERITEMNKSTPKILQPIIKKDTVSIFGSNMWPRCIFCALLSDAHGKDATPKLGENSVPFKIFGKLFGLWCTSVYSLVVVYIFASSSHFDFSCLRYLVKCFFFRKQCRKMCKEPFPYSKVIDQ